MVPGVGPVILDQHRPIHQQVAAIRTVAADEGVEVADAVGIFALKNAVVAVLRAAGEDDGIAGVVAQISFVIAVEYGIDALACAAVEDVGIHTDAAQ